MSNIKIKKKAEIQEQEAAATLKTQIKQAQDYLSSTDWMVVRQSETGVVVPDEVSLARQEARNTISQLRDQ